VRLEDELGGDWETLANETELVDDFVPDFLPRTASVEGREEEETNTYPTIQIDRFINSYPGDAGQAIRKSRTRFEVWLENQKNEEKIPWDPFASEDEWALTMWLIKNVGQKSTDQFLKLPIVSGGLHTVVKKKENLLGFTRLTARKNYHIIIHIHS